MAAVRWTRKSLDDLQAIRRFVARESPRFAAMLEDQLLASTARRDAFPQSGRPVPEVGDPSIRELLYRGYRIVYVVLPDDDAVDVLTVFHSSRPFGEVGT